ncbi:thioesterase II family protein [Gloeobacter violaceus]|uniref:Glr2850 protein n=1 Tax=Gloeobacter violaceus (strain ATCC 29082 / PCC 7421) TaxID=251221 RepID=Q7NCX6_GLOVI|nr:alpha/beta fold hydrolase [Gloeobacter violaceus]BAC90791.1 glr2850 [Gloeobacter violaceus PCC 7421]
MNRHSLAAREEGKPRLRLFCLPYAGGGTSVYSTWNRRLPPEVQVCTLPFPGREQLWQEALLDRFEALIERLVGALEGRLDQPYALFGHSLGALVAFELARRLRQLYGTNPVCLFVSGRQAPHLADRLPPLHALPAGEFVEQLRRRYNGIPQAIFENPEWLRFFLPVLRADIALLETYEYTGERPFTCPICVFGGLKDSLIGIEALEAWRVHTVGAFQLQLYPGDHFFIHDDKLPLVAVIAAQLHSEGWIQGGAHAGV